MARSTTMLGVPASPGWLSTSTPKRAPVVTPPKGVCGVDADPPIHTVVRLLAATSTSCVMEAPLSGRSVMRTRPANVEVLVSNM